MVAKRVSFLFPPQTCQKDSINNELLFKFQLKREKEVVFFGKHLAK